MVSSRHRRIATVLWLCALCNFVPTCDRASDRREKRETEREQQRTRCAQLTQEFAESWNADASWKKRFDRRKGRLFSLDLQRAMRGPAGRIAFSSELVDVEQRGELFVVTLRLDYFYGLSGLGFRLHATPDQVRKLTNGPRGSFLSGPNYLVVAVIDSVKRVAFHVNGYSISDEELELEVESGETFIASGTCIAIEPQDPDC